MLSYQQIFELIDKLNGCALTEISIAQGDFKLTLKKEKHQPQQQPNISFAPFPYGEQKCQTPSGHEQNTGNSASEQNHAHHKKADANQIEITSPMVGTFYSASGPDSEPFVQKGQKIKTGDVLCIIEAMKVMNELSSEHSGTIEEIYVKNNQTVEFGQILFTLKLS